MPSRQVGAAFFHGTAGDRESGDAFARAVRGLFGQVPGDDGCGHNCIVFLVWLVVWEIYLCLVVKPMNPGKFAFGEQFRLSRQLMLHMAPGQ
jgi:hypothetical protein